MKLLLLTISVLLNSISKSKDIDLDISFNIEYSKNLSSEGAIFNNAMPLKGEERNLSVYVHFYQLTQPFIKSNHAEAEKIVSFIKQGVSREGIGENEILADHELAHVIHDLKSDKYYMLIKNDKSWSLVKVNRVNKTIFQIDTDYTERIIQTKKIPVILIEPGKKQHEKQHVDRQHLQQ